MPSLKPADVYLRKRAVTFTYLNHRGDTATRHVVPLKIWFGSTDYHPEDQWILDGFGLERQDNRQYAMNQISNWAPGGTGV